MLLSSAELPWLDKCFSDFCRSAKPFEENQDSMAESFIEPSDFLIEIKKKFRACERDGFK